ncbi:hypothetical protein B0A49_00943 [Cryomyces minteri]|uniref:RRM domain-containing protein n=1 Tax=Cryomyces minteri TaxID=331657 RepID=A0A4U0XTC7_9PEZI|nr:hypothetical protein B0A49_00943 [Cryomyces minteri]
MAGKLDKSLDDILKGRRQSARRPRGGRPSTGTTKAHTATAAPVGGVKKTTRSAKPAGKATVPTGPSSGTGESKIIVSNLPEDVEETQIKDYFGNTIGPVKKVLLTYGPNGRSRGVATIIFVRPASAAEAAKTLDGVKVDNRAMKIEVVVGAKDAPALPPAKGLGDRIAQSKPAAKAQPKPANAAKASTGGTTASARGRGGRKATRGGRNPGRAKPKTAEELDAEMQDYFVSGTDGVNATEGGATTTNNETTTQSAAVNGGDVGMDDEIL